MRSNNTRVIDTKINVSLIKDQVAALMYSLGYIKNTEEVLSLEFGNPWSMQQTGVIPIRVEIKKERRVKVLTLNDV